ncbi:UDP-glucosyltransferase 2-like [Zerene cesonia]|uniref:UDP-glucosyltransferase 2-like n=1 Tax=Zerene cesonia TaxID=33412 RepID=UPI0018E502AE|nr:UDP-glucosyltransferase 2-like [Zerene cesonia]
MSKLVAVFALFIISLTGIESAKILAWFPTPSISHQVVFRPIIHELARRGHQVVLITPDPVPLDKSLSNLTQIDVHDVSYAHWQEMLIDNRVDKQELLAQIKGFIERFTIVFDKQSEVPEVKRIIKEERDSFDLIITEACVRVTGALGYYFKKPVVLISSFGLVSLQYSAYGAPFQPFLFPTPGRQRLYNLSLAEKALEIVSILTLGAIVYSTEEYDYQIMRKHFGEDVPSFDDLSDNVKLLLLNEHPLWADNHPVGPNIKYIGGVHQTPQNELPKDLKEYLDSSTNGVIYISFGTNVKTSLLAPEVIDSMIKVLSRLPYNVLWKWDEELPSKSMNIKTSKWFPQADLLRHPNVKLFITQGGLQSTDEAISAGVPVIGMPVLGDQWYNAEKYVHHKIGLQLDLYTLTEESFRNAIETVIGDPSYKKNMLKLRAIMRDAPIKPLDNAIWWIEHVIKHGGDHLRPPAMGLSWAEYYEVNLLLSLSLIVLTFNITCFLVLRFVYRSVRHMYSFSVKIKKN